MKKHRFDLPVPLFVQSVHEMHDWRSRASLCVGEGEYREILDVETGYRTCVSFTSNYRCKLLSSQGGQAIKSVGTEMILPLTQRDSIFASPRTRPKGTRLDQSTYTLLGTSQSSKASKASMQHRVWLRTVSAPPKLPPSSR